MTSILILFITAIYDCPGDSRCIFTTLYHRLSHHRMGADNYTVFKFEMKVPNAGTEGASPPLRPAPSCIGSALGVNPANITVTASFDCPGDSRCASATLLRHRPSPHRMGTGDYTVLGVEVKVSTPPPPTPQ